VNNQTFSCIGIDNNNPAAIITQKIAAMTRVAPILSVIHPPSGRNKLEGKTKQNATSSPIEALSLPMSRLALGIAAAAVSNSVPLRSFKRS
jgi:hypothetical protein